MLVLPSKGTTLTMAFSAMPSFVHTANTLDKRHLSSVDAHHQNELAENAIQTVTNMGRAYNLHATLHWPDCSFIDLWSLAMNHAV